MGIGEHLRWILDNYLDSRKNLPFNARSKVHEEFKGLADEISNLPAVNNRPTLHVSWGVGVGNWARIPWVAILDERETKTTQEGVYPDLLVGEDGGGVCNIEPRGS